jgi:hypothetical protein
MQSSLIYETAETLLCAGSDIAATIAFVNAETVAERQAVALMLDAFDVGSDEPCELPHTRDVLAMIRAELHSAAWSMHLAFAQATMERAELDDADVNLLDLTCAAAFLEADRWRVQQQPRLALAL